MITFCRHSRKKNFSTFFRETDLIFLLKRKKVIENKKKIASERCCAKKLRSKPTPHQKSKPALKIKGCSKKKKQRYDNKNKKF